MKSLTQTILTLGVLLAGLTTTASADTYRHIDDLANDIARRSRELVHEVRHYRHTPEYRHLVADAVDMRELAEHMHEVAHHHGSISHLECDLRELDSKFHHLESVFDRVERNASRGHGCIRGNTAHVKRLLDCIEDDIHHLQDDVRELRRHARTASRTNYRVPVPPAYSSFRPSYGGSGFNVPIPSRYGSHHASGHRPSRYGSSGLSFSIGGGSSRMTFSF